MFKKNIVIILLLLTLTLFSQTKKDLVNSDIKNYNVFKLNSIKTDWNIINSSLRFFPINSLQPTYSNNPSLYALYTDSQINAGINFELQPDVMLKRFQLINNWETKKKYGVFAKYLGIAQFMGAIGIAAVSIANQNIVPKGKTKFKGRKDGSTLIVVELVNLH